MANDTDDLSPDERREQSLAAKRQEIRRRYYNEAELVMRELVPELKKIADAKGAVLALTFDVNGATSYIVIEMGKRGCQ